MSHFAFQRSPHGIEKSKLFTQRKTQISSATHMSIFAKGLQIQIVLPADSSMRRNAGTHSTFYCPVSSSPCERILSLRFTLPGRSSNRQQFHAISRQQQLNKYHTSKWEWVYLRGFDRSSVPMDWRNMIVTRLLLKSKLWHQHRRHWVNFPNPSRSANLRRIFSFVSCQSGIRSRPLLLPLRGLVSSYRAGLIADIF